MSNTWENKLKNEQILYLIDGCLIHSFKIKFPLLFLVLLSMLLITDHQQNQTWPISPTQIEKITTFVAEFLFWQLKNITSKVLNN